jgi:hypothetical protein
MITEIGLVLGLYVLTRLLSGMKPWVAKPVSALTLVITVLVLLDLTIRIFRPDGVAFLLSRDQPSNSSTRVVSVGATARKPTGSVTRADGGSITTLLGYGIAVAKGSSLKREWIAVHDSTMPVALEGTPGITTVYASKQ